MAFCNPSTTVSTCASTGAITASSSSRDAASAETSGSAEPPASPSRTHSSSASESASPSPNTVPARRGDAAGERAARSVSAAPRPKAPAARRAGRALGTGLVALALSASSSEGPALATSATALRRWPAYCALSSPSTSALRRPNASPAALLPPPAAATQSTSRWPSSGRSTSIALSAVSAAASSVGT